ncbi:WYL domain-containing protein [Curvibacter delicatus]|jgi:hypothetical protein|uniref:WYL domain-containing protein n=1 Tax=Curvibacter delicatus TaxID=80879 RepID=UPI000835E2EF|nr:WYL domain-containing protein [Curvibacter delicatus]
MTTDFNVDKLRFAQRQRLTFIESVAFWEGRVDRPRVSSVFNVSENHVTKDFRLYKDAFPGNLQYDETARAYRPTRKFKPHIGKGSAEEYLALLRAQAEKNEGVMVPAGTTAVTTDAVPPLRGRLEAAILNAVTRAISSQTGLTVSYQSRSRAEPSARKVWPHALLFSGTRWHARAYDEERNTFIDLVLQRILTATALNAATPRPSSEDKAWARWVEIDVVPSRALSASQAEVVAREFGMNQAGRGWVWRARMRECLVGYFIYLHRLDLKSDPQRLIELKDPALAQRYLMPRGGSDDNISKATA